MSPASKDKDNETRPASLPRTRTRTGCERCRSRRRKCDESKPQCNRCIDAGSECRYVSIVSFLDKNSRTIERQLVPETSLAPGREVQFVNYAPSAQPPQSTAKNADIHQEDDSHWEKEARALSKTHYEVVQLEEPPTPRTISPDAARLLAHYMDRVAPWLDILDASRTFGVLLPRLAMESSGVLKSILHLSASTCDDQTFTETDVENLKGASSTNKGYEFWALQEMVRYVFGRARAFVETQPTSWDSAFIDGWGTISFSGLRPADKTYQKILLSLVVLMVRFEVAHALIKETRPAIGSEVLKDILAPFKNDQEESALKPELTSSIDCLALLVDATRLCLPAVGAGGERIRYRNESWRQLSDRLQSWFSSRPPGLLPLAHVKDGAGSSRGLLFTHSAGFAAAVFYHTALMILLSVGQDSRDIAAEGNRMTWNAHQICDLAQRGHHLAGFWDPCTIASLILAVRRAGNSNQDLSSCIEELESSGWNIDKRGMYSDNEV